MIKIDEDTLIEDLVYTAQLFNLNRKDFTKKEYNCFSILNASLTCNSGKAIIGADLKDKKDLAYAVDKYMYNSYLKFIEIVDKEQYLLRDIARHFCRFAKKIKLKDICFFDEIREYSEKDFKDIIISYFAARGDRYYKIAKKYFDENRINVGSKLIDEAAGYYAQIIWLKSGYIYNLYPTFDSVSAASVVHELGHAIDAETFLFPQQKKLPIFSDILLEVPSTTFEMGFYDYLRTQKIDTDGGLILKNSRILDLLGFFLELKCALAYDDLEIAETGKACDSDGNIYDLKTDIIYGLGYYFALHLNLINEYSTSEFQKVFNNIISTRKESTLTDSILMSGFCLDDFITGKYIKPKIKEDYLTLKKRYKIY